MQNKVADLKSVIRHQQSIMTKVVGEMHVITFVTFSQKYETFHWYWVNKAVYVNWVSKFPYIFCEYFVNFMIQDCEIAIKVEILFIVSVVIISGLLIRIVLSVTIGLPQYTFCWWLSITDSAVYL